ncbi:MAG: Snf7 family protein [Candidatus Bathyarchaeia archaeon]
MGILNRQQSILPTPESINELKRQSMRLEQVNSKLRERDRSLFEMVGKAVQKKDTARAQIYANELSRVRHIKRILTQSQLAIDCITIRLENFLDLYNVVQEMRPISEVVREVSADVQKVMPEFASGLEQLNMVASETLMQTSIDFRQPALDEMFSVKSQESADILREVSGMVENSLHESFPEPPIAVAPKVASRQTEAVAYGYESTFAPRMAQASEQTNDWSMLSDDVVKMLDQISAKGRVKMEEIVA